MVETRPILTVIIGPWALASLVRDSWGLSPMARRLPTRGRPVGPGGSLILCAKWRKAWIIMKRSKEERSMVVNSIDVTLGCSVCFCIRIYTLYRRRLGVPYDHVHV